METFRELEKKFFIKGMSYKRALEALRVSIGISNIYKEETGNGRDWFWKVDDGTFNRVRVYNHPHKYRGQLSTKRVDRVDIVDRLETNINLATDKDAANAKVMMTALYGEYDSTIWKQYHIFWLTPDTNIVVYLTDHKDVPLIVEIEALEMEKLKEVEGFLHTVLDMEQTMESLYQLSQRGKVNGGVLE